MILTRYDAAFHIQCEKQDSFEEGEQAGIRQGIFALIGDNLDEHVSADRIIQKLQRHFQLTLPEAQQWILRYENEKI